MFKDKGMFLKEFNPPTIFDTWLPLGLDKAHCLVVKVQDELIREYIANV